MPEFNIGRRTISLRQALLESDDRYRRLFATQNLGTATEVTQQQLQLAEDHLDVDLVGDLINLDRYVKVGYRDTMGALTGDRLGAIAEALTWLEFRRQARRIVRVVGTEPPAGRGRRVPRPDFITREGRRKIRLVEVKATDAYSAAKLADGEEDDRPCSSVRTAARSALRQLGVDSGTLTQVVRGPGPHHSLVVRGMKPTIPFPGDAATAVVWLARDRRLDARGIDLVAGEQDCAQKGRVCVGCIGAHDDALHLMKVQMPNSPQLVPLWPSGGGRDGWFAAYEQWARADWLGHPIALQDAADRLWEETIAWMRDTDQPWNPRDRAHDESASSYRWWREHLTIRVSQAGGFPLGSPWFDRSEDRGPPRPPSTVRGDVPRLEDPDGLPQPIQFGEADVGSRGVRWSLRTGNISWDLRLQETGSISNLRQATQLARTTIGLLGYGTSAAELELEPVHVGRTLLGWTLNLVARLAGLVFSPQSANSTDYRTRVIRAGQRMRVSIHRDGRARLLITNV